MTKITWILLVISLSFVVCTHAVEGPCTFIQFTWLFRKCQTKFIGAYISATDPSQQCPQLYQDARDCAVNDAIAYCFGEVLSEEAFEMEKAKYLNLFGEQDMYCLNGTVRSISDAINMAQNSTHPCSTPVNQVDVDECEAPFYEEFRRNASSDELCNTLYTEIRTCQSALLMSCDLTFDSPEIHYELSSTTSELDPFCSNVLNKINDDKHNIALEPHPTAWNVIAPIIVVCCLIALALLIGVCHMARKDTSKPQVKSKKVEEGQQGEEMASLKTEVKEEDEGTSTA